MMGTVRILAVDDDPKILRMLERGLTLEGYKVTTASSGSGVLELWEPGEYDLVILDLAIPAPGGLDLCRLMRKEDPRIVILMLTAKGSIDEKVSGLEAGADDYMVKPFAFEELTARIKALSRRVARPQESLSFSCLTMNPVTREVSWEGIPLDPLTPTEYNLLETFLRHPRIVLGRLQLIRQVWGNTGAVTENSLDLYISYLRKKLEVGGRPRLIHTLRGVGYVLKENPDQA